MPGGDYNVTVTYLGDNKFNANKTSKAFTVVDYTKQNTDITSDVAVDGNNVTITVNVDSSASGFVKFTLNGNDVFVEVVDGKVVNIPSFQVKPGMIVAVREKAKSLEVIEAALAGFNHSKYPWISQSLSCTLRTKII